MAIVCDVCKKNLVIRDGETCNECIEIAKESAIDKTFLEKIYLPPDVFERFETLRKQVEEDKTGAKKALSKFLQPLKTSFINRLTGKEINDPTPRVIIPKERTLDRIQKILNHNLSVYADQNDMDTEAELNDWSVSDVFSDDWEKTLYQLVDEVVVMEPDDPAPDPKIELNDDLPHDE